MKRAMGIALLSGLAMAGCSTSPEYDEAALTAYLEDKPAEMHGVFEKVVTEGESNHVLNRLRAGVAAMDAGDNALAAQTFDEALLTIETMYGGSDEAAEARGMFTAEDRKIFRGEPYERAMAYYYRGVLYLMEGDYENARASFKSGSLQDALAEKEEFRQDFALLEYLDGWASQCNGDVPLARDTYANLARDDYAAARSHNGAPDIPGAGDNLLVLAELGHAPVKYAEGKHDELLKVKRNLARGPGSARVRLNGRPMLLSNGESVLWQAMTRGGREFDSVLAGKVNFKEGMEDAAEVGMAVSTAATTMSTMQMATGDYDAAQMSGAVGAVAGLFSLFASAAASETEPAADTRQWDNLPETVAYGTYRSDSASRPEVEFEGIPANARPTHYGGDESCSIAWAKSQPGNPG